MEIAARRASSKVAMAIFESYDGTLSQSFCNSTMARGDKRSGRMLKASLSSQKVARNLLSVHYVYAIYYLF